MTSNQEIEDIKKQIELFDKLTQRPLWKDVLVIFMFNLILALTFYLMNYKDVDFDMSAYVLRLLVYVIIGTALLVPGMRKLNQMSLQKLQSKLNEYNTSRGKK